MAACGVMLGSGCERIVLPKGCRMRDFRSVFVWIGLGFMGPCEYNIAKSSLCMRAIATESRRGNEKGSLAVSQHYNAVVDAKGALNGQTHPVTG